MDAGDPKYKKSCPLLVLILRSYVDLIWSLFLLHTDGWAIYIWQFLGLGRGLKKDMCYDEIGLSAQNKDNCQIAWTLLDQHLIWPARCMCISELWSNTMYACSYILSCCLYHKPILKVRENFQCKYTTPHNWICVIFVLSFIGSIKLRSYYHLTSIPLGDTGDFLQHMDK